MYVPIGEHLPDLSRRHRGEDVFCVQPFFAPLLFDNSDSDARDHCANERSMVPQIR